MRRRASRRSVSSWVSPGPRVPTPPPRRSRCCHMPRMRGRLYSSCASSTWSLPSALDGVLGEDVEDQLRAVDDARLRACPRASRCWTGRARRRRAARRRRPPRTPPSAPRACPCRRRCACAGLRAVLDELADRLDAGGARELAQLGELLARRRGRREHRDDEPALGLGARRGSGWRTATQRIMPAADGSLADLAARTLELVDIPSESRDEAELAEHVAAPRAARAASTTTASAAASRRAPGGRSSLFAGHLDTVPAQGNLPGRIEDGAVHGLGASDMKGGLAVMIELARWAARRRARARPRRFLFFPREELRRREPAAGLFAAAPSSTRRRSSSCWSRRTTRSSRLPRQRQRARRFRRARALRAAVAGVNAIARRRRGARARRWRSSRATSRSTGSTFREVLTSTRIHGGIADNVVPGGVEATLNFRYAPDRTPRRRRGAAARARRPADELEILANSPAAHVAVDRPARRSGCGTPAASRSQPKQAWTPVAEFAERGPRRGQPRPGRDPLRAPAGRAGRDRRARRGVRGAAALPGGRSSGMQRSRRPRRDRRRTRSCGSTRRSGGRGARHRADRLRQRRPAGADRQLIRDALVDALDRGVGYPLAAGLPELREAIAGWVGRRFGVELDPDARDRADARLEGGDLPLRAGRRRPGGGSDLVVVTEPGYPVASAARCSPGAEVAARCRCARRTASCPTSTALDDATWRRTAIFWVNYPNNPTGAVAPLAFYERARRARRRARLPARLRRGVQRALVRREPPARRSRSATGANVVVFNTLSKRSSMTGYRSRVRRGDRRT